MNRITALSTPIFLLASSLSAADIDLGSGATATGPTKIGLIQAPIILGGPQAGNILVITVEPHDWDPSKTQEYAAQICTRYAFNLTQQARNTSRERLASGLLDTNAPVIGVSVVFRGDSVDLDTGGSVRVNQTQLLDMRGFSKSRPL